MKKWMIGLITLVLLPCVVHAEATASITCTKNELHPGDAADCTIAINVSQAGLYVNVEQMYLEAGEGLTISNLQNGTISDTSWQWPVTDYDNYNIVNSLENVTQNTRFNVATFKVTAGDVTETKATYVKIRDYTISTFDSNYENEHEDTGTDVFDISISPRPLDSNNELGYLKISTVGDKVVSIELDEYIPDEIPFEVTNDTSKVKIEASPASESATLTGVGTFDLRTGDDTITTFTITVKAEDGTTKNFVIKIHKKESAKPAEEQQQEIEDKGKTETTTDNKTTPTTETTEKAKTVKNPKTSVTVPIILVLVLGTIALVTYYFKRKDRFMKF